MGKKKDPVSIRKHINTKSYFENLGVNIGSFDLSLAEEIFQQERDGTTALDQLKALCTECGMGYQVDVENNRLRVGKMFLEGSQPDAALLQVP